MFTSPNLGLAVWNVGTDPYSSAQLASNFLKVDQHNHSSGKGLQIPTGGIVNGAVTVPKLGSDVIALFPEEQLWISLTPFISSSDWTAGTGAPQIIRRRVGFDGANNPVYEIRFRGFVVAGFAASNSQVFSLPLGYEGASGHQDYFFPVMRSEPFAVNPVADFARIHWSGGALMISGPVSVGDNVHLDSICYRSD